MFCRRTSNHRQEISMQTDYNIHIRRHKTSWLKNMQVLLANECKRNDGSCLNQPTRGNTGVCHDFEKTGRMHKQLARKTYKNCEYYRVITIMHCATQTQRTLTFCTVEQCCSVSQQPVIPTKRCCPSREFNQCCKLFE
jgi:transposase